MSRKAKRHKVNTLRLRLMKLSIDRSPESVFWIDPSGRLNYVNDSAYSSLGYSREELLKMMIFDIDTTMSAESWPEHWKEVERKGTVWIESYHRTKDRRTFPVEVTINHVRFNGDIYHVSYVRDLTERKRSEQLLRTIFNNTYDAIFIHEIDGKIVDVNDKMLAMYGVSKEEALRFTIRDDFSTPEDPVDQLPILWKKVVAGENQLREWKARRPKDGSTFDAEVFLSRINFGGRSMILANVRDISQRKMAENQRLQLAKEQQARIEAVKASRAKDLFIASVSHELRTPLTAILTGAQLLRSGKLDESGKERIIEKIEKSAQTQAHLVNDLLDVSRIILGKLALNMVDLNPAVVARQAIDLVHDLAESKSIEIKSSFDPEPNWVRADPVRLQQVIWNLLTNSVKFSSFRSQVEVRISRGSADRVLIQVIDQGRGISPEFLPYIFNHFSQADDTSVRMDAGLGLGLAIVRNLVELQGGKVWAESLGEGQGATFTICLPRATKSGSR